MLRRRTTLAALAMTLPLLLGGCGGDDPAISSSDAGGVRVVQAEKGARLIAERGTVVLDVRTPEEFAAGHVEGARNVDVNDPGFRDAVRGLDRSASYVVYCRSGNRSAAAARIMEEEGFTDVADAGALGDLQAAGASVSS